MGKRAKARRRVKASITRLSKRGYTFKQSFIEKVANEKTHFEKIDLDTIYRNATKGGVSGLVARSEEASERARKAARTRRERQERATRKPDVVTQIRNILDSLETGNRQYYSKAGRKRIYADISPQKAELLNILSAEVSMHEEAGDMDSYNSYLETQAEYINREIEFMKQLWYWEEVEASLSNIATSLKGSALTFDESRRTGMSTEKYNEYLREQFEDRAYEYQDLFADFDDFTNTMVYDESAGMFVNTATGEYYEWDTSRKAFKEAGSGEYVYESMWNV